MKRSWFEGLSLHESFAINRTHLGSNAIRRDVTFRAMQHYLVATQPNERLT
jgi:aminopeptidase N